MQIHELTQPQKPRLDEIDLFGPGGLGDEISSAVRNAKTVYNPADMAKSLLPTQSGKDARQRLRQAQADADQDNLNRHAAKAIAKGKQMGLDQTPTLASSMKKLQANPVAKEWVAGIVANWPQEAKNLGQSGSTIKEELTPKDLDPNKMSAAARAQLAQAGVPGFQPPAATPVAPAPNEGEKYKTAVKNWIDTQLKTIKLDTIVGNETKFPQLNGIGNNLGDLLDIMVAQAGNIPAQQETLKKILTLVTAANHVIDWERRVGRGQTLADPGAGNQTAQPVNTGLTTDQLKNLGTMAARSGDPAPKDTGSDFWNSFIQQAIAAAKR
jgi:hypothetical protein